MYLKKIINVVVGMINKITNVKKKIKLLKKEFIKLLKITIF